MASGYQPLMEGKAGHGLASRGHVGSHRLIEPKKAQGPNFPFQDKQPVTSVLTLVTGKTEDLVPGDGLLPGSNAL